MNGISMALKESLKHFDENKVLNLNFNRQSTYYELSKPYAAA